MTIKKRHSLLVTVITPVDDVERGGSSCWVREPASAQRCGWDVQNQTLLPWRPSSYSEA
jgi:hypothetical protein